MNFKISYYGLDRFYEQNKDIILKLTDSAFKEGQFLESEDINKLELSLANYCNRKYALTVSSCSDALYFSMLALGITANDEVLLPSFSFIATLNAVLRIGATPVFFDVNDTDLSINLDEIASKKTHKTKAIIVVPLYGYAHDYAKLEEWCKKENIFIIEDAAQAIGSSYNNKMSGSWGNVSCLSFDPSKIIHAFGTGGAVLTDNEELYQKLKFIRYQGKYNDDFIDKGYNSRISTLQAKLLSWQLENIQNITKKRNELAKLYFQELFHIQEISFPKISLNVCSTYHKFVIFCSNRDELKSFLDRNGIQTLVHYPKLLFEYSLLKIRTYKAQDIVKAHNICKKALSLPLYVELTNDEIDLICRTIKNFYK